MRETGCRHGLVLPLFVDGPNGAADRLDARRRPPLDRRPRSREAGEAAALGVPGVILFGIPEHKDAVGSEAWNDERRRPEGDRARSRRRTPT